MNDHVGDTDTESDCETDAVGTEDGMTVGKNDRDTVLSPGSYSAYVKILSLGWLVNSCDVVLLVQMEVPFLLHMYRPNFIRPSQIPRRRVPHGVHPREHHC